MQISKLRSDVENYRWLDVVAPSDMSRLSDLHDGPAGPSWTTVAVRWMKEGRNWNLPAGDFPTLGTTPVFSKRAVDALLDLLVENGEILPLDGTDGQFWAYNTTRVVDALDEEHSTIVRFGTGRILDVTRYAFFEEKLEGSAIFRLPQLRGTSFVTEVFADRISAANLAGFDLRQVWPAPPALDQG